MMRINTGLIAAVLVLSGALALTVSLPANPQNQVPPRSTLRPIETPPNGRYQIANGTPDQARNIMLLDTQTGKTWIICNGAGGTAWCIMNTGEQAGKVPEAEAFPSPSRTPLPTPSSADVLTRDLTMKSLLGQPSGASDGAVNTTNGVKLVSKDGKWQLP